MSIAPWADFLDARARLIHEWMRDGIPGVPDGGDPVFRPAAIASHLNQHDPMQIRLISMTPLEPPMPCSSRHVLQRIAQIHARWLSSGELSAAPMGEIGQVLKDAGLGQ